MSADITIACTPWPCETHARFSRLFVIQANTNEATEKTCMKFM